MKEFFNELKDYKPSLKIVENWYVVQVVFPTEWKVVPPTNKSVAIRADKNAVTYAAKTDECELDDVLVSIKETIGFNQEAEQKLALFKEKINELQELFKKESIEKLRLLRIGYETVPEGPKKRGRKPKNAQPVIEYIHPEDDENTDVDGPEMPDNEINEIIADEEPNSMISTDDMISQLMPV